MPDAPSDNPFDQLRKPQPSGSQHPRSTRRSRAVGATTAAAAAHGQEPSTLEVAGEGSGGDAATPEPAASTIGQNPPHLAEPEHPEAPATEPDAPHLSGLQLFQHKAPSWANLSDVAVAARPEPNSHEEALDWSLVRELRKQVSTLLEASIAAEEERGHSITTSDERRVLALPLIHDVVGKRSQAAQFMGQEWSVALEGRYEKAIDDSMYGLGRWQPLLEIPDAENVVIYGNLPVVVDHADGRRTILPPVADSDAELMEQISLIASNATPTRAFDNTHIDVTINYKDRFRIHAVADEVSQHPSVTIRQHRHTRIGLGDLVDMGVMPREVAVFLARAVADRRNIFVVGAVGDGKTTFLRALIDAIPINERFATLETDLELFAHLLPGREHTLVMTARDGHGERNPDGSLAGEIRVGTLIAPGLRQWISRIIVGELRGDEAGAMFEAMQAGSGSMATLHSPDAKSVPERLAGLAARSGIYSLEEAHRQIGLSVDLVVHVTKVDAPQGRRRFVREILSFNTGDTNRASSGEIYTADRRTGATISFNPAALIRYDEIEDIDVELRRYATEDEQ